MAWALPALASDREPQTSVMASNDFEVRYWIDDERVPELGDRPVLNYVEQVNRFNLSVARGAWSGLVQVDQVMLLANRYEVDGATERAQQLLAPGFGSPLPGDAYANLEKIRVRYATGPWTLTLGDAYAAFGTGIALNVNRNVDIDVDTSIQGLHGRYRADRWDLTVLFGQLNRQQVFRDNPNRFLQGDYRHTVGAARLEGHGLGPATVGVHGVLYDFVDDAGWGPGLQELGTVPDAVVGGATLDLYGVAGLDWQLEADAFAYPTDVLSGGQPSEPGYALYGSTVAYLGATTWQLEGKRYRNAVAPNRATSAELYDVVVAPSLEYERVITEDSAAAVASTDIVGGRLRTDWTAVPGTATPYGSLAVYYDRDTGGLHFNDEPEIIVHAMTGAEVFAEGVTLFANLGARRDHRVGGSGDADRLVHADADLKVPLGNGLYAHLAPQVLLFDWGDNGFDQKDFAEIGSSLTVSHGSTIAVTVSADYTDNPLMGMGSDGNLANPLYGAVEVQVKPSAAVTLQAFAGARRAGIQCSGGQCRFLPGFEGVRFAARASF